MPNDVDKSVNSKERKHDDEFDKALEVVPAEQRKIIESRFIGLIAKTTANSESILASKISDETIQQMIASDSKRDDLISKDNFMDHVKQIILGLAFLVVIVIIVYLLKDKPENMEKIVYSIGSGVVGFAGGYGFGKSKQI